MPPLTNLELAVREGNLSKLKRLYNFETLWEYLSSDVANRKGARGCALLHHACEKGHYEIVLHLVENLKVNIDTLNDANERPIHCASYRGYAQIVRFLLFSGALKQRILYDSFGQTPLHLAAVKGHLAVVMLLVKENPQSVHVKSRHNAGATAIHGACRNGHLEVARYLIEIGRANVNVARADGKTPLHLACHHLDLVIFLVESCLANVHARSAHGETPLHIASRRGCLEVVQYLVIHGRAKVDLVDASNMTPLHGAISKGRVEVASFLLSHGVPDDVLVIPRTREGMMTSFGRRGENQKPVLDPVEEQREDAYTERPTMVEEDGNESLRNRQEPVETDLVMAGQSQSVKELDNGSWKKKRTNHSECVSNLESHCLEATGTLGGLSVCEKTNNHMETPGQSSGWLYPEFDPITQPEMSADEKARILEIVGTVEDDENSEDYTVWGGIVEDVRMMKM